MKITKLPNLKIKTQSRYSQKLTQFEIFKYVIYAVLSLALLSGVIYLNVIHEQTIYLQNKPNEETTKPDVLILNKTASIISRDGNIPIEVAKTYTIWIYEAAARYSLDPILLLSVMYTESKFNYKAVSPTGPIGLFQVAASYHKEKTTSAALFDPRNNIMVGAQIIREYTDLSRNTVETLLRYNGSLGQAPIYATKVISTKHKYDNEIMKAMAS